MKTLIRQILPLSLKRSLRYQTLKQHFERNQPLSERDKKIIEYFEEREVKNAILLAGFKKSGNTWTKFVIFNYFNILLNNADETLTYKQLDAIQCHVLNGEAIPEFSDGFPVFYDTYEPYQEIWNYFNKVILIYRNPLDTLISLYYFLRRRKEPFMGYPEAERKKLCDIDYFVLYELEWWILYYQISIRRHDVLLCYENMRADPYAEFRKLFNGLFDEVDGEVLKKSIAMSSFENIKTMGREKNQMHGMGNAQNFVGEFTRSGTSGQYRSELKKETVEQAKKTLHKSGINLAFHWAEEMQ